MKIFKFNPRLTLCLALMLVVSGTGRGADQTAGSGALIGEFQITPAMLDTAADCEKDATKLNITDSEAIFESAICRYHRNPKERDIAVVDRNIETLQKQQRQGLSAAEQALAALLEGLSHCQRATLSMNLMKTDVTARSQFCGSRSSAAAALSSVPWRYARFGYQSETGLDVDFLINKMSECYAETTGPLNGSFDSTCGIIDAPTPERQAQIIDKTFSIVESRYFGGASPITAMFMEKKSLAEKVLVGADQKARALKAESDRLLLALNSGRQSFYRDIKDPNNDQSPLDIIVKDYKNSYALAKAILARYDEWQRGLLVQKASDGTEKDLALQLVGPQATPSLKDRLMERTKASASVNGLNGQIDELVHRLTVLQSNRATYQASAKKMCGIYYCHLAAGAESDSLYRRACNGPVLFNQQKNPLCENVKANLAVPNLTQSAKDFCGAYGFDVAHFGKVGMTPEQASSCVVEK